MAEINIPINAEISGFLNQLGLVDKEIEKITADAVQAGNTIKKGFTGSGATKLNTELQRTDGLIEDIENSLKQWEVAKRKATNTTDIEKYNKKIAEGKQHLQEYNTKGVPALKNVNTEATKGQSIFSKLGAQIGAAFSVYAVLNFAKETIALYNEQLKNENKLKAALGERVKMFDTLKTQSEELRKATAVDDATIMSVQSFLAVQGRTESQIKKMTEAALNLSVVLGIDVNTAAKYLDQTFEGTIGRLGKYDERLKHLTQEQLANGDAITLLSEKYSGMAAKSATDLDKISSGWSEWKESIGKVLTNIWTTNDGVNILSSSLGEQADVLNNEDIPALQRFSDLFNSIGMSVDSSKTEITKYFEIYGQQHEIITQSIVDYMKSINVTDLQTAANYAQGKSYEQLLKDFKKFDEEKNKKEPVKATDYTKLSTAILQGYIDEAERLGESASLIDTERAKAATKEIARREKAATAAKEYNAKVLEGEQKLLQQQIDLMDEGTTKIIAEENLRYEKEIKAFTQSGKQLSDLKEGALKVHKKKIQDIEDKAAVDKASAELKAEEKREKELIQFKKDQKKFPDKLETLPSDAIQEAVRKADQKEADDLEKQQEDLEKQQEDLKNIKIDAAKATAQALVDILGNIEQANFDKQRSIIDKGYNQQIKALDNLKKKKLISDEDYEKKREAIEIQRDKKTAELQRKDAIRKKELALFNIAIKTAENIVMAANPLTAPMIAWIIAMGAIEAAVVASQPIPKLAEGGKIVGKPHSLGGTLIEAEKDEWFINKISSNKYDKVLNNINKDNSFAALKELAQLNGISIDHKLTNDIHAKEKLIDKQRLSLNEIPEIKEIRDLLKKDKVVITNGKGYRIEKFGNVERKIYEN